MAMKASYGATFTMEREQTEELTKALDELTQIYDMGGAELAQVPRMGGMYMAMRNVAIKWKKIRIESKKLKKEYASKKMADGKKEIGTW